MVGGPRKWREIWVFGRTCFDVGSGKLEEDQRQAFPGQGHLKPDEEEMRRLRRELERVREERDILKKALAIFSVPSR